MKREKFKFYFKILVILLFAILLTSCGSSSKNTDNRNGQETKKEQDEQQGQDGQQSKNEQQGQDGKEGQDEQTSGKNEYGPYVFIPHFDEQTIYNADGFVMTAIFDEHSADNEQNLQKLMYCRIKNDTEHPINVSFKTLETEDGLLLGTLSNVTDDYIIEPHSEDIQPVYFLTEISYQPLAGDYSLYQDYKLGEVLGNFRLNGVVLHATKYDHLLKFSTDYIKTDESERLPDYSEIRKTPLILDKNGVKLYQVDQFYVPKENNAYFADDYYYAVLYCENENEFDIRFSYDGKLLNDQEYTQNSLNIIDVPAKGKCFGYLIFSKEGLEENNMEVPKSASFSLSVRKLPEDENSNVEDFFETDPIKVEFKNDWRTYE